MCNQLFTPLLLALSLTLVTCLEPTKTTKPIVSYAEYNDEFKRSDEEIVPYNANDSSRYVELLLVVDRGTYKKLGGNMKDVSNYCKNLVNIVNSVYTPLNIFIALVGLVVWTEKDEIDMSTTDATMLLDNFRQYKIDKLNKDHPHDHAHLLINQEMDNNILGIGYFRRMCWPEWSVGWTTVFERSMVPVALSAAHDIGHGLGIKHNSGTSDSRCDNQTCIMNAFSSSDSTLPASWSSCNKQDLDNFFKKEKDNCLRNKPTKLYDSPVCGNMFVEAGEECDCGIVEYCNDPCCDPTNCTLFRNGVCATETTTEISKKQKGKEFTVITHSKLNWYEALKDCKRQGLRLATVESQEEQDEVIKSIELQDLPISKEAVFWLSGSDLGRVNDYLWMTSGQPLNYTAWYSDEDYKEPNHAMHGIEMEHCLSMRSDYDYKWNDDFCSRKNYYICDNQA